MNAGAVTEDRFCNEDFTAHNQEVRELWPAVAAGQSRRIGIIVGTNSRYFMASPAANPRGTTFRQLMESPDLMFQTLLEFQRYSRFNIRQDAELGLPAECWEVTPDFQTIPESAWFGCPIEYFDGQVPDTRPAFWEAPEQVMDHGIPDPFAGIMGQSIAYYQRFSELAAGREYLGRPIRAGAPWTARWTDGPMTIACNLFSPAVACELLAGEPERIHRLFAFITEAVIARITAMRQRLGLPRPDAWAFADDSIALISTDMLRDHVLPYHRRLLQALAGPGPHFMHLCGDATRHFPLLQRELNVGTFDTGFPVDFGALREQLGPEVTINGGPHVELLRSGTPQRVREETARILRSGILRGGRFVLREGNNLAPGTPLENIEAMYQTGRRLGTLPATPV